MEAPKKKSNDVLCVCVSHAAIHACTPIHSSMQPYNTDCSSFFVSIFIHFFFRQRKLRQFIFNLISVAFLSSNSIVNVWAQFIAAVDGWEEGRTFRLASDFNEKKKHSSIFNFETTPNRRKWRTFAFEHRLE